MKHVTPPEDRERPAPDGPADRKARRRRRAGRQAGLSVAVKPAAAEPSSPPKVLADFHPTAEQIAKARKWLVKALARRAVELLNAERPKA